MQQAARNFGGIDVLINNAGAIALTGVEATSLKQYGQSKPLTTVRPLFVREQHALSQTSTTSAYFKLIATCKYVA